MNSYKTSVIMLFVGQLQGLDTVIRTSFYYNKTTLLVTTISTILYKKGSCAVFLPLYCTAVSLG